MSDATSTLSSRAAVAVNGVMRVHDAAAVYVVADDTRAASDTFDAEIDAAVASLSAAGVRSLVRGLAFSLALSERYSRVTT